VNQNCEKSAKLNNIDRYWGLTRLGRGRSLSGRYQDWGELKLRGGLLLGLNSNAKISRVYRELLLLFLVSKSLNIFVSNNQMIGIDDFEISVYFVIHRTTVKLKLIFSM
jgi:hypothetical protein